MSVQYQVTTGMILGNKPGSQYWGLCIPRESENHVNVSSVASWDVKEPLKTTSTFALTTLNDNDYAKAMSNNYTIAVALA